METTTMPSLKTAFEMSSELKPLTLRATKFLSFFEKVSTFSSCPNELKALTSCRCELKVLTVGMYRKNALKTNN